MSHPTITRIFLVVSALSLAPMVGQAADYTFDGHIILSDPCAVFAMPGGTVTPINYGELVSFDIKGSVNVTLDVSKDGDVKYRYGISVRGDGTGGTSGIRYLFNAKALFKADTDTKLNTFSSKFKMAARILGQSKIDGSGALVQGAQDNALLRFSVNLQYANGSFHFSASDFTLECMASPWTNQMDAPSAGTKTPVGRGFGDPWNKYAWSMKDFNGGVVVGTKNAFFDYFATTGDTADPAVVACMGNAALPFPSIYKSLACLELFGHPAPIIGLGGAATNYAEIWRMDYSKKDWAKVRDEPIGGSQGFRIMEIHNGKLYVGSDLGAFVTGITLGSRSATSPFTWDFPGSRLLSSVDGKTFAEVPCAAPAGPCNSATGSSIPPPVNVSFRALASYKGKLYLGTFNYPGAELWSYTDTTGAWELVQKFWGKPALAELRVYNGSLYIGFFGVPGANLYVYTGTGPATPVTTPAIPSTNLGVLTMFTSKGLLFVGSVDLNLGFSLRSFDGTNWASITENGFLNSNNAYAWSMAEVDGRILLGTFNQDFFSAVPRGSAELWYSDDAVNWQQAALPLNWGVWNYGIRNLVVGGDKQVFVGTASNMIAPGLPNIPLPLSPGAEVWTIKVNDIDPKK